MANTYNSTNVETYNFRGFTVKFSSAFQDYRVYDGEKLIGADAYTWNSVNKIIDAEMRNRKADTIDALNATIEAQAAELVRLRAELAATQNLLKRVRNNAVAMSQPDAFKVGR